MHNPFDAILAEINEYLFKKQQAKRRLKKKMKYNKKAKIFLGLNTNAM